MFNSTNFTPSEQISLSQEISIIGVQATPFTSMLMAKGNVEKALSTVYTWKEKQLQGSGADDFGAVEGSDDIVFHQSARAELNNILEIFSRGASISGTAIAMKSNEFAEQVNDRLLELKISMEKKFLLGEKKDGSVTPFFRQMGGLFENAHTDNAVTDVTLTEATIKEAMRKLWNNGLAEGTTYAFVNADLKEAIDDIYKDRYGYSHVTTDFGLVLESINTNYGKVNFVLSSHIPANKIVYFNDSYVDLVYLRQPHFEALSKNGDSVRGMVVAEATLKYGSSKAVGVTTIG